MREERAPWTTREKMSRPMASVPNQCSAPGGWTGVPEASGSYVDSRGAKRAARPTRASTAMAIFDAVDIDRKPVKRPPALFSSFVVVFPRSIRCS